MKVAFGSTVHVEERRVVLEPTALRQALRVDDAAQWAQLHPRHPIRTSFIRFSMPRKHVSNNGRVVRRIIVTAAVALVAAPVADAAP